jgi:hypothetical protein
VLHSSTCVRLHYSIFLIHLLDRTLRMEKKLSWVPMSRTTSPVGVRTSKLTRSSARSEATFPWMTKQVGYTKARGRSWWHDSKVDWHHVWYLLKISDTRAPIGQMVDVCKTTTIWLDDRCNPSGTLGWEWTMCKHYLGKSSRYLKQTRKDFWSSILEKQQALGLGCDLL